MTIDFMPVFDEEQQLSDYAAQFSVADLRQASVDSVALLTSYVAGLTDAEITYAPQDPDADDPFADEDEQEIGWGIGHLVAHVTASCEEWAGYSSLLARGVAYPAEPRLRYETAWRDIDTAEMALQRLQESLRMRLAYLDAWPDAPDLELKRELSPRFIARFGEFNATTCFLFGLQHEVGHYDQFEDVREQIEAARAAAAPG